MTLACLLPPCLGQSVVHEVAPFEVAGENRRIASIAVGNDSRLWWSFGNRVRFHDGGGVGEVAWAALADHGPKLIRQLSAAPDGSLWIADQRGLWRVPARAATATLHPALHGRAVQSVIADRNGNAWARSDGQVYGCQVDGSHFGLAPVPGGAVRGIAVRDDAIWAWNAEGLWSHPTTPAAAAWQPVAGAPRELELVVCIDDRALAVATHDIHTVDADGVWRRRAPRTGSTALLQAVHHAEAWWVAGPGGLLRIDDRDSVPRQVRITRRGQFTGNETDVQSLALDGQGLLWLGLNDSLCRLGAPVGIRNELVEPLPPDDGLSSLAELDGETVYAGTHAGRLLHWRDERWSEQVPPWRDLPDSARRQVVLAGSADGVLWAGTQRGGVWRLVAGEWSPLTSPHRISTLRAMLPAGPHGMWIAGTESIWRATPQELTELPLVGATTTHHPRPSALHRDGAGRVWLGTFLDGIYRWSETEDHFAKVVHPELRIGILGMASAPEAPDRLWLATSEGLLVWDARAEQLAVMPRHPDQGMIRALLPDGAGGYWLAQPRSLAHHAADGALNLLLPPFLGALPSGYTFRSGLRRDNGELWLGGEGSLTRILPGARSTEVHAPRLQGCEVLTGAHRHPLLANTDQPLVLEETTLRIMPKLVDRRREGRLIHRVVLRHVASARVLQAEDGSFTTLPPGDYVALVASEHPTGRPETTYLGQLRIEPPRQWAAWLPFGLGGLLAGAAMWFAVRSRRRLRRNIVVERMLQDLGDEAESMLDICFLAIARAEECMHKIGATQASVWLRQANLPGRALIAEFGTARDDAESRAACCCSRASPEPGVHVTLGEDGKHLLVSIRAEYDSTLEILLSGWQFQPPADAVELTTIVQPILVAMQKLAKMGHLEEERRTAASALAADIHDIRGPLTVLKLGARELVTTCPHDGHAARMATAVANAADRVISAIDALARRQSAGLQASLTRAVPDRLVAERLELFASGARDKAITLASELGCPNVDCLVDATWLGRAIDNLLGNALKFTPTGGRIVVGSRLVGAEYQLTIEDSGPGFQPKELEAVFLPGVVGSARPTAGEVQQGLGLWIARRAIRAMHGDLRILSPQAGAGAAVVMSLPAAPRQP